MDLVCLASLHLPMLIEPMYLQLAHSSEMDLVCPVLPEVLATTYLSVEEP